MTTPELALWEAVRNRLLADADTAAICGDRIYDEVPSAQADPPYLYLAAVNWTRVEGGCGRGHRVRMRLYCVTAEFGRIEAWSFARRVERAIDLFEPDLPAPLRCSDAVTVVQCGDVIGPLKTKEVFLDIGAQIDGA